MSRRLCIAFRADASIEIGSGHIMRCLALANALMRVWGARCVFLCRNLPQDIESHITIRNHAVHHLVTGQVASSPEAGSDALARPAWSGVDWEEDAQQCAPVLADLRPEWVIVDHYALDARWEMTAVPPRSRLLVIDDLADRHHCADILLDQNIGRLPQDYDELIPAHCTRLIGSSYALLRPEFAALRADSLARRSDRQLRNILVTMGGTDKGNTTEMILKVLVQCDLPEEVTITVILGGPASGLEQVKQQALQMPWRTEVFVGVTDMATHMATADLAIGAAGTTSWERCCLGLPTLVLIVARNQIPIARALTQEGAAILLGDISEPHWAESLRTAIKELCNSDRLGQLSRNAAKLCDGNGTDRVLAVLAERTLDIRPATHQDSRSVWLWRYAEGSARFYPSGRTTPYSDHERWFENALSDNSRILLIVEEGSDPVAHIRLDICAEESTTATVSICVAPECRGKRLAGKALAKALEYAQDSGLRKFVAHVHGDNVSSVRLFERLGFIPYAHLDGFVSYACERIDQRIGLTESLTSTVIQRE